LAAGWADSFRDHIVGAVGCDDAKEGVVLLGKPVEAQAGVVAAARDADGNLCTFVARVVMVGGNRRLIRPQAGDGAIAVVGGVVRVDERGSGKQHAGPECVNPGEVEERVAFALYVADKSVLLLGGIRDLEKIVANGRGQAKLVDGIWVEDERSEAADAVGRVVKRVGFGRHEAEIGTIGAGAGVIGETIGVVADADLAISGMEAAVGGDQFDFAVALEAGARDDIEGAVDAVAVFGGVSAAFDFDDVHVLGIKLSADIGGDVGIGHGDAVYKPG